MEGIWCVMIDTAVIAAGGEGRRMKESGIMIPKPLVTFQNKPLISYVIDSLLANNITKIIILEPLNSSLREILIARYPNVQLNFIKPKAKQTLLETLVLIDFYLPERFILVDADIVLMPNTMKQFIDNLINEDFFGAIAVVIEPKIQNNHYLTIDNQRIVEFNKNNIDGFHGGYLYLFNKKIINKINHELMIGNYSFSSLITKIAKREKIIPSYVNEIFDIDTYDELVTFENIFYNL